jgi:hypothetical protein
MVSVNKDRHQERGHWKNKQVVFDGLFLSLGY